MSNSKMIDQYSMKNITSTALSISENSRGISKIKPKIRIIQIIDPEIIKTDPTNFRELVQSLTGKSSIRKKSRRNQNKKKNVIHDLQKGMPLLEPHHESKRVLIKNETIKEEIYQPWEGDVMINTDFDTGFFSAMDSLADHQDLGGFPSMFSSKPSNVNLLMNSFS